MHLLILFWVWRVVLVVVLGVRVDGFFSFGLVLKNVSIDILSCRNRVRRLYFQVLGYFKRGVA